MLRSTLAVSVGWLGVSMISDGVPALLLPHRLLADGQTDATALGLASLAALGVGALIQPLAGRWSDRVGRFPAMATGSFVALAGLAVLLAPGGAVPGTIVTLAGVSIAQAGHQALLPDRLPAAWRGRAGGLKSAFDVGGAFLAFLLLAALLGAGLPGVATAALAAVLVAGFVTARLLLGGGERVRGCRSLRSAYRLDLVAHGPLLRLVVARFLFLLGIYVVGRFLLLFLAERRGLTADAAAEEAGVLLAVLALVTVVASLPGGWLADRIGRRWLMLAGGALAGVGTLLLPTAGDASLVLVFGGLMAAGSAAFGAASWAMLGDLTASDDAGRLLGIANVGTAAAAALAGAFGLVVDNAGFSVTFALAAACSAAGGLLAFRITEHAPFAASIASAEGAPS